MDKSAVNNALSNDMWITARWSMRGLVSFLQVITLVARSESEARDLYVKSSYCKLLTDGCDNMKVLMSYEIRDGSS
jgi:hypothetical protein